MELSVRPVGTTAASAPRPAALPVGGTADATSKPAEKRAGKPALDHPSNVALASWFDRNGDGKIDATTWVQGGDAFLPVDADVAASLDGTAAKAAAHTSTPVNRTDAAADAYRRYGAAGSRDNVSH